MDFCLRRARDRRIHAVLLTLILMLCMINVIIHTKVPFRLPKGLDEFSKNNILPKFVQRRVSFYYFNSQTLTSYFNDSTPSKKDIEFATTAQIKLEPTPVQNLEHTLKESPRKNLETNCNTSARTLTPEHDPLLTTSRWFKQTYLSLAYKQKWVGFPDFNGRYCQQALRSTIMNSEFQGHVHRVGLYKYTDNKQQCQTFQEHYGYNRYPPVSEEEKNFSIAFIILFHNNFDQVMFLLRALYRPHNVYCLSIDGKNDQDYILYIKKVVQCLPNVFVASKLEKIVYAGFSRLMADIHCMSDLLKHPVQWKYVINMPGQQFPLRTNLELVRLLTMFNGTNNIEVLPYNSSSPKPFLFKHVNIMDHGAVRVSATSKRNPPPPYNMTIVKGSTYGSFSRAFVQFALQHPVAKEFLEYCKNIFSPDEYFWSTLQQTGELDVPGGNKGSWNSKPYITSYSLWSSHKNVTCATRFVHRICIFTPEDLPNLSQQKNMFANKLYIYHHPGALHCLDEWLFNRTVARTIDNLSEYKV